MGKPPTSRVAFIGLGTMGSEMAANLIRGGFEVTVHNRTRDKERPLAEMGAARAENPASAAARSDIVVIIVSDTPDVEEVIFAPFGVAEGAADGSLVIDMSTIDPESTRMFASRLSEKGIRMIDAPVSGGTEGARAGTLSIMVGGSSGDVAQAMPLLETMGSKITHIGPVGSGQMAKAINQVVVGGTLLAVAEGIVLGTKAGLDMTRVLEALAAGAAGSWSLSNRGPKMLAGEFPLGFRLALHRKDLGIALAAAERLGADLPGTRLVVSLEDALIAAGFADSDVSAIVRAVQSQRN